MKLSQPKIKTLLALLDYSDHTLAQWLSEHHILRHAVRDALSARSVLCQLAFDLRDQEVTCLKGWHQARMDVYQYLLQQGRIPRAQYPHRSFLDWWQCHAGYRDYIVCGVLARTNRQLADALGLNVYWQRE